MKVSIDGGETWIECNDDDVRIDLDLPTDEHPDGNVMMNFTDEGVIADWFVNRADNECEATMAVPYDRLVEHLFFGE